MDNIVQQGVLKSKSLYQIYWAYYIHSVCMMDLLLNGQGSTFWIWNISFHCDYLNRLGGQVFLMGVVPMQAIK